MFSVPELQLIRASLDHISIKGADAKFLAYLQTKVEDLIQQETAPPQKGVKQEKK